MFLKVLFELFILVIFVQTDNYIYLFKPYLNIIYLTLYCIIIFSILKYIIYRLSVSVLFPFLIFVFLSCACLYILFHILSILLVLYIFYVKIIYYSRFCEGYSCGFDIFKGPFIYYNMIMYLLYNASLYFFLT